MRKQDRLFLSKDRKTLYITIVICFSIFLVSFCVLIISFNNLMEKHDQRLSGEICNLVSEKINNAIEISNETVIGIASVISDENIADPQDIYNVIKDNENYISMGFIDAKGNVYATESEKEEFDKWDLIKTAKEANPISLSVPYRNAITGQLVVTRFVVVNYNDSKKGWIFATSPFKDLQNVASTEVFSKALEIWFMDSESANMIYCNSSDESLNGSWANGFLTRQMLDENGREQHSQWIESMRQGKELIGNHYEVDGDYYASYSARINSMPGWYVVVRIPSSVLSDTMNSFRNYVLNFLVVLLSIVVLLIFVILKISKNEKQKLEDISKHDPLTSLLNRRAFEDMAIKYINTWDKSALIFFDVDYFKKINDGLGHDAGDILLEKFASIMQRSLGDDAKLFRVGGDEFVAIIKMDSVEAVNEKLDRAKAEINSIILPNFKKSDEGTERGVTFSAGLAIYPDDAEDLGTLKRCADTALYIIKERGRNGYCWYNSL
ncbi:diguanylate cyclase (GGDEF) domain-containing protein [Pseudobutyrivibrio sp. YE44]|uniref:sensor domain-containing diguanylate cyclase n=1 Tax=Pseudobutyrivibrio sp. YE44 TaxID=1520802 RepID=UPI00088E219E|nr:sensor domain-containing diguanylate cyclase [Pseudobutyrivibrio sp. YE44]SDB04334.1 diguanylate cyclase (GGDEF) domain-containing protein [Pseudobutyrivibrio sp. YE44]